MSKYIYPILHWRVDGTVISLNTNSIYSVDVCGTTHRPGLKVTIEL